MKYFVLILLTMLFAVACSVEDDETSVDMPQEPLDGIQVRLRNDTGMDIDSAHLAFSFGLPPWPHQNYGLLTAGSSTDYKEYNSAGLCSVDFYGVSQETSERVVSSSVCNCICQLDTGLYTVVLTMHRNNQYLDHFVEED